MQSFNRSKHSRKTERNFEEEEELRRKNLYLQKLQAKGHLVKTEFEQHKKRIMLSGSELSKANEVKLQNEMDKLFADNNEKRELLAKLREKQGIENRLNSENKDFAQTISQFNPQNATENMNFSMEYHPAQLPDYMSYKEEDPEILGERIIKLKEACENIERQFVLEEEVESAINSKYEELLMNKHILVKRTRDMKAANEHFAKRFVHLKEIEFIAQSKQNESVYHLNEVKDLTKDLSNKESVFKKDKHKQYQTETTLMQEQHKVMSNVLLSLDEKKIELDKLNENLKTLDRKHEVLLKRKSNTGVVARYAMLIENVYNLFFDPSANDQTAINKNLLELREREKIIMITEEGAGPEPSERRHRKSSVASRDSRMSYVNILKNYTELNFPQREDDRDYFLGQINKFYDRFPDGPQSVITKILEIHAEHTFKERSLGTVHQEAQQEKRMKEIKMSNLNEELAKLIELVNKDKVGSNINSNAPGAGIIQMEDAETTTINQAKFAFHAKKIITSDQIDIAFYETFLMRCYLDSMEMISRLGKLLHSAAEHSDYNMPDNLRRLAKEILIQISQVKKIKRKRDSFSATKPLEISPQLRTNTGTSIPSERDHSSTIIGSDVNEALQTFLIKFGNHTKRAHEFVDRLRQDTMIGTFIKIEDIQVFLDKFHIDANIDEEMEKAFDEIPELRARAVENMLKRLQIGFLLFADSICLLKDYKDDCNIQLFQSETHPDLLVYKRLEENNEKIPVIDLAESKVEPPNETIKAELKKRYDAMIDKYDEDALVHLARPDHPNRRIEMQMEIGSKEDENNLNKEDFHNRLHEVTKFTLNKTGVRSYGDGTAFLSKTKKEEEQRRLMIKAKKEKIKQAFMSMNEDQYLDWKRRRMRNGEDLLQVNPIPQPEEPSAFRSTYSSQAKHAEQKIYIDELKKMIQSSKILAKINVLERHKSVAEDITKLKHEVLGNYIPNDPIVIPRTATTTPKARNLNSFRNVMTPLSTTTHQFKGFISVAASNRNSPTNEASDSVPDRHLFRSSSQVMSSRISRNKNQVNSYVHEGELHLDFDPNKMRNQSDFLGLDSGMTSKSKIPPPSHFRSMSQKFEASPPPPVSQFVTSSSKQKTKLNNLLNPKAKKATTPASIGNITTVSASKLSKTLKVELDQLPKLSKKTFKPLRLKQKRQSLPDALGDSDALQLFNADSDPKMKSVYYPEMFVPAFYPSPNFEELSNMKYSAHTYNSYRTPLLIPPVVQKSK